jgi:hypothetical protein
MLRNKIGLLFLVGLLLVSCAKKMETLEEMNNYLGKEENELTYRKTINGVDFTLQYRPTDVLVKQELANKKGNADEVKKLRQKYGSHMYFNLSMSKNNAELLNDVATDRSRFSNLLNDLVFQMDKKVYLYTPEKDTIPITDFVYPRMYGMGEATTIMFVYPKDDKILGNPFLDFCIEDLGFYTGEVRFKINTEAIKNQPTLNL